jgi:hypothetical protein
MYKKSELSCLGATLINIRGVHYEMKTRISSANDCYHPIPNPLSSRLLADRYESMVDGTCQQIVMGKRDL